MKKRLIIKRAILRKVLNVLGVCTIGLIAACAKYGVEISTSVVNLKGAVKSKDSLKAIENIQLQITNSYTESSAVTDENGKFSINGEIEANEIVLNISDIDGSINGNFISTDTIVNLSSEEIQSGSKPDLDIELERDE